MEQENEMYILKVRTDMYNEFQTKEEAEKQVLDTKG